MSATITYKFRWTTPKKNISAGDVVKPKTLSQQEHPEQIYKAMIHKQEATHVFKRGDSKLKHLLPQTCCKIWHVKPLWAQMKNSVIRVIQIVTRSISRSVG